MPKIGVYICHSGENIAGAVNIEEVKKFAGKLPDVVVVRDYLFMCSDPGQELIKEDIRKGLVDRVVVAACTPKTHEPIFRRACEEAGLNKYYFEMAFRPYDLCLACATHVLPGRLPIDINIYDSDGNLTRP